MTKENSAAQRIVKAADTMGYLSRVASFNAVRRPTNPTKMSFTDER